MRLISYLFKWLLILFAMLVVAIAAFMYLAPAFGASAKGEAFERIKKSSNFKDDRFVNLIETSRDTRDPGKPLGLMSFLFPPDGKNPVEPLPTANFTASDIQAGSFVWLGHSTVLFNNGEKNAEGEASDRYILFDPIFYRASPIPYIANPFALKMKPTISQLPDIDFILISHDHYDHLDHKAIAELEPKTTQFLVPLGVGAHLLRWGVPEQKIAEFDWYDAKVFDDMQATFTPSRHFSGRAIKDHFKTLWGSWAIKSTDLNVYFSGDGGYSEEFKKIGEQLGPFDIAFIENGAYSEDWAQIHMMPEQSAQASIDVQANLFFPIHWSKFDLAQHRWTDPIDRATIAAENLDVKIVTPLIGEPFNLDNPPMHQWWLGLK